MERAVGKSKKLERFKLESLELERFRLSLKVPIEVGKFLVQYSVINFPTSTRTIQLYSFRIHFELSNLKVSNLGDGNHQILVSLSELFHRVNTFILDDADW